MKKYENILLLDMEDVRKLLNGEEIGVGENILLFKETLFRTEIKRFSNRGFHIYVPVEIGKKYMDVILIPMNKIEN